VSDANGAGERLLPPEFAEFEPFVDWALPTEPERYQKRLETSMDEIRAFYDVVAPRAAEARDYLDQLELTAMPIEAQRLLWILFSLICISFAVDVFEQPRVPDTDGVYFERSGEPQTFPV
jgi:hypothetical protein